MRTLVLLAAVVALGFAPAPLPRKPVRSGDPRLDGEWAASSWAIRTGRHTSVAWAIDRVRIVPGRLVVGFRNEHRWTCSLALDPAAGPSRLELCDPETGRAWLGIYRLEGDTLTICYRDPDEGHPREFHDRNQWMVVLRRKRP